MADGYIQLLSEKATVRMPNGHSYTIRQGDILKVPLAPRHQLKPVAWVVTVDGMFTSNVFEDYAVAAKTKSTMDSQYPGHREVVPLYDLREGK